LHLYLTQKWTEGVERFAVGLGWYTLCSTSPSASFRSASLSSYLKTTCPCASVVGALGLLQKV
ncbi:MAG: hypothetical protein ACOYYJ_03490, partial [Chloroflexota bacterium]